MKGKLLVKMLEYDLWANNMVIKAVGEADAPEERVIEILSHLVIAPNNWIRKILDLSPVYKAWDKLALADCRRLSQDNLMRWMTLVLSKTDEELEQSILLPFMGISSRISIEDLVIHLINHSSYHRGQIIHKLKGKLKPLPLSTYIAYTTQKVLIN